MGERSKSYGSILESSSIIGGAQGVNYAVGLVRTKVVAILLGPSGIGLLGLYTNLQQMLTVLAGFGVSSSAVREIAKEGESQDPRQIASKIISLRRVCWFTGVLGWLISAALCVPISRWVFEGQAPASSVLLLGAAIFLAIIDISRGFRFRRNLNAYKNYVETFKAINRTVMTKTWVVFHMTKLFGVDDPVTDDMPPRLRGNLALCHQYATTGTPMPLSQQREFYEDYFRWEQVNIVGPTVDKATSEFDWPIMKWFCLRPWVWFSYFQLGRALVFKTSAMQKNEPKKVWLHLTGR